jgi:hypothetical protein
MFPISPVFGIYFLAIAFAVGALIGAGASAVVYRSRRTVPLAVRAAVLGGLTYLGFALIGGWAEQRSVFEDGRRIAIGPNGENLWFRNLIANNQLIIGITSSAAPGLLAGVPLRRRNAGQ